MHKVAFALGFKNTFSAWLEKLKFYVATACDSCRASYPSSLMM